MQPPNEYRSLEEKKQGQLREWKMLMNALIGCLCVCVCLLVSSLYSLLRMITLKDTNDVLFLAHHQTMQLASNQCFGFLRATMPLTFFPLALLLFLSLLCVWESLFCAFFFLLISKMQYVWSIECTSEKSLNKKIRDSVWQSFKLRMQYLVRFQEMPRERLYLWQSFPF